MAHHKQDVEDMLQSYGWSNKGDSVARSGTKFTRWEDGDLTLMVQEDGEWCFRVGRTQHRTYGHGRSSLDAFMNADWAD